MPELTGEQVKQCFQLNPQETSHKLAQSLREFGYTSVTDGWVQEEMERLIRGEQPRGGPALFLQRWLTDGTD